MTYTYLLTIIDDETGDDAGTIEARTQESLEEQLRKIPEVIKNYEAKQLELSDELNLHDDEIQDT